MAPLSDLAMKQGREGGNKKVNQCFIRQAFDLVEYLHCCSTTSSTALEIQTKINKF